MLMIYKKNEKKSVQFTLEVVDLDFFRKRARTSKLNAKFSTSRDMMRMLKN